MKKIILNVFKYLVVIMFNVLSIILLYYLNKLNILKTLYFVITCFITLLIDLFLSYKLLSNKSKKITKVIVLVFIGLLSVFYMAGTGYIKDTIDFRKLIEKINEWGSNKLISDKELYYLLPKILIWDEIKGDF